MPVLKLTDHDAEKELAFELDYLASLTCDERLRMVLEASDRMAQALIDHGQREPVLVAKRPLR